MSDTLLDFDTPQLAKKIEEMTPQAIDALPFGVIKLDADGRLVFYSEAERRLSGAGAQARLGIDFFSELAPCMAQDHFKGRIERARAAGKLDLEFTHIGDFEDRDREITIRAQSASDGGVWIFLRRED